MSHDPLITWPSEIPGSLTGGGSARKRLSRHQLLVIKENWICAMTRHHTEPNIKILLARNLPFNCDVR